jgi:ribosome maturation factor RimP
VENSRIFGALWTNGRVPIFCCITNVVYAVNQFLPDHISEAIDLVCSDLGVVAVDVRLRGQLSQLKLEIDIDSHAGVSHVECTAVSRSLDERLETDPFWVKVRSLDVSSPGADTPVRHTWQLAKHVGRTVRVTTLDGATVEAPLAAVTAEGVTLTVTSGTGKNKVQRVVEIPSTSIQEARVIVQW